MDDARLRSTARRLRDLMEPLAANVYFAPEVHEAMEGLGFGPGRAGSTGIVGPNLVAYFTSRGACMGTVTGQVVAAAFGVFDPALVIPSVEEGWRISDRDSILAAREQGATASLRTILGESPDGLDRGTELFRRMADAGFGEGHHLYCGLSSLGYPDTPLGDLWRAADLVREHRGDSHIAAWCSCDLDAVEVCLLSDARAGAPLGRGTRTRGWGDDAVAAGLDRLRSRGLVKDDEATPAGLALREEVEWRTDLQERRMIEALGDDAGELFSILEPWTRAIVDAKGYPYFPERP
jgi:hypothetical protein